MNSTKTSTDSADPVAGYGQYCPLALAAELLCRRWSILVISRVIDGCRTFSEIQRGIPRITPSLLTKRLGELVDAGILVREPQTERRGYRYGLSAAGKDLDDIVMAIAVWGQRWARDMTYDDLDPAFLAWSMHTRVNTDAMPPGRTVLAFQFSAAPLDCDRFWLVVEDDKVDMCLKDPGHEPDLRISSDLRTFVEAWRGFRDMRGLMTSGAIDVQGPSHMRRALPDWLLLSALAPFERRCDGREKSLAAET